jgi:hypothetical protein
MTTQADQNTRKKERLVIIQGYIRSHFPDAHFTEPQDGLVYVLVFTSVPEGSQHRVTYKLSIPRSLLSDGNITASHIERQLQGVADYLRKNKTHSL